MVEATIVKWFKSEGDPVKIGEALVELETEKANFEVAAEKQGVLSKILKQDGEDVEVGEVLGSIEEGKAGDAAPAKEEAKAPEPAPEPVKEAPKQETEERVTPVAKRVAEENNVDVSKVRGTGPSGRVTKEDVEAYIAKESAQPAKEEPAKSPSTAVIQAPKEAPAILHISRDAREERVKMSRRRRTIARRMLEASQTTAMLTTFNEIDMGAVMDLRKRRKDASRKSTASTSASTPSS